MGTENESETVMENANVHDTPTYTNIDNNEHETTNDSDIVNEDTTAVKLEKPKTVKPAVKRSFPKDVLRLHRSIDSLSAGQAKICDGEEDFNDGESITIEIAPSTGPYEGGKFKFKIAPGGDYPDGPPYINCVTDTYHPNIDNFEDPEDSDEGSNICVNLLETDEWSGHPYTLDDCVQAILFLFYNPNWDDALNASFQCPESDEEFAKNVRISLEGGDVDGHTFEPNYGIDIKIIPPYDKNDDADNVKQMNEKNMENNDETGDNETNATGNDLIECENKCANEEVDTNNAMPNTANNVDSEEQQAQTDTPSTFEETNDTQTDTPSTFEDTNDTRCVTQTTFLPGEIENAKTLIGCDVSSVGVQNSDDNVPNRCVQLSNTQSEQFQHTAKITFVPFDNVTPNLKCVRMFCEVIIVMNRLLTRNNHNRYVTNKS